MFTEKERIIEVDLFGLDQKAIIQIKRNEQIQQPIGLGDKLVIDLSVMLPCDPDNIQQIHPKLALDQRFQLLEFILSLGWGRKTIEWKGKNYRIKETHFYTENWKEGFDNTENYAKKILNELSDMLKNRQIILNQADFDEIEWAISTNKRGELPTGIDEEKDYGRQQVLLKPRNLNKGKI